MGTNDHIVAAKERELTLLDVRDADPVEAPLAPRHSETHLHKVQFASRRPFGVRHTHVLSIAKLAGTDQRYYLDQAKKRVDHAESVASGAEDYYLTGPEAAGRWVGGAATDLALEGDVGEVELRQVLSRRDPRSGGVLPGSVSRARVPGFDLMFSVPKSASILFGLGDAEIQRAVLNAQQVAVEAGMKYLEKRACRTRRGPGGREIVEGRGFVGAAFGHRTSRAGDPQVHTHVLVANATRTESGDWGSLDGRALYAEARTAGFVHEATFRRELTRRLGVRWTQTRNGIAELEGVPRRVIDAFSRRKAEIDAQVAEWRTDSAEARQKAAVKTRARKDYGVTPEDLAPEWKDRARAVGFDHRRIRDLFGREGVAPLSRDEIEVLAARLLSPEGLTERVSTFDRRDVVRAVAEAATQGISLAEIDAFVAEFVRDREVITLADARGGASRQDVIRRRDGRIVSAVVDSPVYSTAELLSVERRVVQQALEMREAAYGIAACEAVEQVLTARSTIGSDQAAMVRRLCGEGAGVQVVVGPPGTGKTFALDAAREAWQRSGYTVIGAAVARRAAMELSDAAGIESTSVTALLADLRHGAGDLLSPRTVVVCDEAAMLGTRPLAELLAHTAASHSKLVLVGDHAQLPEIDAGGAFRALVARLDPIELTTNRRQERAQDLALLNAWREGSVSGALTIACESGDLVLGGSAAEVQQQLVRDFCESLSRAEDAIMLAHRRADVRRLNELARGVLRAKGIVAAEGVELREGSFARGDRVVLRLNAPGLRIENGTRGEVLSAGRSGLRLRVSGGKEITIPQWYMHTTTPRGGPAIEHGYASTAHLAQGMTTDRAFVLGSETVYREWGYVAWSRARRGTRFYAVEPELDLEHHSVADPEGSPFDEVVRRLERSEAQQLALDSGATIREPSSRDSSVARLRRGLEEAQRSADAATRERLRLEAARIRRGRRAGAHRERLEAARKAERDALRRVGLLDKGLHELQIPTVISAQSPFDGDRLGPIRPFGAHVVRARRTHVPYIEAALGSRPASFRARRRWDRSVRRIERFRATHGVADPLDALGAAPLDLSARRAWKRAQRDLDRARLELGLNGRQETRARALDR